MVVADNDPDALDLVVTDLSLEGHDVVGTAVDGAGAIARCVELRPDVLVVDLRMPPGLDGIEVSWAVLRALPGSRVVLFTNHFDARVLGRAPSAVRIVRKGDLDGLRRAVVGPGETPPLARD